MSDLEEKKKDTSNNIFLPYLLKVKNIVLGENTPKTFTKIVFFIGLFIAFIFEIWNSISFFILKSPDFLKKHKQVDVKAIIELRGKELGFKSLDFYQKLEFFHLSSIIIWGIILIGLIFLWRQKKWSIYLIIVALVTYISILLFSLSPTYFIEDLTLFDKINITILFILMLIQHFVPIQAIDSVTLEEKSDILIDDGNNMEL